MMREIIMRLTLIQLQMVEKNKQLTIMKKNYGEDAEKETDN